MPLQHINDTMLRRMQRRVNRAKRKTLLGKLRRRFPNLVLRTTFITGFPGETDEQFEELVDFVGEQRFERLGCSPIRSSPTRRRPACPTICPKRSRNARREQLMAVQQEIAFAWNQAQVGKQWDVLIDRPVPDEKQAWIGRAYADAPDIDGVVLRHRPKTDGGPDSCPVKSWRPGSMI